MKLKPHCTKRPSKLELSKLEITNFFLLGIFIGIWLGYWLTTP